MTDFGFSGRFKLKKTDEFSSVFNFRRRIPGTTLVMHYMPTILPYPRLGLIIGKKTARLAVQRNYMKRVLREAFRYERPSLSGVDILIRVQKTFTRKEHTALHQEFNELMHKLRSRLERVS